MPERRADSVARAAPGWLVFAAGGVLVAYLAGPAGIGLALLLAISAGLAATWLWLYDRGRMKAMLTWVAGPLDNPPPFATGHWRELGDRFVRALRLREAHARSERDRLVQFLAAIEASPIGVLLLDADDAIEWLNRTAAEHFGLDRERDLRQRITYIVRAPAFVAYLHAGSADTELVLPSPRGDASLSLLARPYGDSMRLVLSQDITERERTDAMRRDFVANVSHEIRSPLTVLTGFVDTMAQLPLSPAERERALTVMRQQAERMQTLVSDLLVLAQIEGAPRPSAENWVGVPELLRRLEIDIQASDRSQHTVTVQADGAVRISGVESELFSAFWNLASNALRYTPAGGRVDVTWRLRPDGSGEFSVCDTGPGIAREHIPRLTERFYRVDTSRSRATGGTGLGLAIVKHVVQRHGGELVITSEVGKGSQFRIQLPPHRLRRITSSG